uniref:CMP-sialic acid transporter 1 isoform X3 n=1 Tax=Rhizophora mucronata TaxID=61149 RepID=A0A2P2KUN2_RHIMU
MIAYTGRISNFMRGYLFQHTCFFFSFTP